MQKSNQNKKTRTVLIIHGIGGHAGIHWQQWLHDELTKCGYNVLMPDMPDPEHPDRTAWIEKIKATVKDIKGLDELIIVAHSLGVPTALDYIEQGKKPVGKLISVSGFAQNYGAELNSYFMKVKSIDFSKVNKNIKNCYVLYGDNDPYVPQDILKSLADELHVEPKIYKRGGHLNTDTGFTTFPDIIELIKE